FHSSPRSQHWGIQAHKPNSSCIARPRFSTPSVSPVTGSSRLDSSRRDQRALTNFRIATLDVRDFATVDLVQIRLEPDDRRLLDELVRELVDRLDPRLEQIALRASADLRHEHRVAVVDGADDGLEAFFLAVAALAVEVDPAMTDELRAGGRKFIDLKLLGVSEMLVDQSRASGRHRDEQLDVAHFAGKRVEFLL